MAEFASRIPLTRPFSARKKKKYDLFSPSVSCGRLRKVQSLLKSEGISALLCILGIDSRYNSGTKQLLNYLLFGYCDITADSISVKITDEVLEDLVILVKLESVHVYCNLLNYAYLLPLIGHWRNLHIHCLAEDEDDEEKMEEFKILSFVSMVAGCSSVGIAYGNDGEHGKPFDPFVVEKWPLVQAFAIEGIGGGGFFTMVHEVRDVTSKMLELYGTIDPVVVEIILTERLPLFDHHCKAVLTNVDVESSATNSLGELTEQQVSEPIVSYFTHGRMSREGLSSEECLKPFVLFGVNTSKKNIENVRNSQGSSSKSSRIATSGIAGSAAKHMVCFARDPRGTIAAARTYVFGNGFVPITGKGEVPSKANQDLRLLIDIYLLAVDAVLEGIKALVQTQTKLQGKTSCLTALKRGIDRRKISLDSSFLSSNVEFSIEAFDFLGRKVELLSEKVTPVIKMVYLYVYDIPSIEHPGRTLGSVAFGETFLDSAVKTLIPDSSSVLNCHHMILTENVTRFSSWQGEESERAASKDLNHLTKSKGRGDVLGEQLVMGDQGVLIANTSCCKWEEGTVYVYEKGILFSHARLGVLTLPLSEMTTLQFYDGETSSVIALVIMTYKPSLIPYLPPHLVNDHHILTLALAPRTRIFRQFYSEVLPLWKSPEGLYQPPLQEIPELPEHLTRIYPCLPDHLPATSIGAGNTVQHLMSSLPEFQGYLAHLNVSSVSSVPFKSSDLAAAVQSPTDASTEVETNLELSLTIITGVPGSGKNQLCSSLVALAKENSKWIILKSPINNSQPFDPTALQTSLSNTLASQRKLHARLSASRKRLKVLVVTPGFTDIADVVMAITNHPDVEVSNHVKIGAVTSCVNPENMYMEERFTLPKLLDQCAEGWVNNIVFTSCLDAQNEQLAAAQKLIRACNPNAAFILAKGGKVTRTPDVELILSESAFMEANAVQKRHLMCPGWSLGIFSTGLMEPAVNEVCINFYAPLEKQRFLTKLQEMQGPLRIKDCLKMGAVHSIRGHVHFTGQNNIMEVHWTSLNGSISLSVVDTAAIPRPPSRPIQNGGMVHNMDNNITTYFIVFTGFSLKEETLKDWLRGCAKPTPQKKSLITKKSLTKKEAADIVTQHKGDALPEGWFYTGILYVSLTGEKKNQHPLLDQYMEKYVKMKNEEINRHNAHVDAQPLMDMFQLPSV